MNRPGFDGGSDAAKEDNHASTKEVSARFAGAGDPARAGGESAGSGLVAQLGSDSDRSGGNPDRLRRCVSRL